MRAVTRRRCLRLLAAVPAAGLLAGPLGTAVSETRTLPAFVVPRDDWRARGAGPGLRRHRIERITLHHTGPPAWYGSPATPAYLRAIQSFHMGPERRWPDIAYHLLVDLDGVVWEGRSLDAAGDTATAYDPAGHALVALLGDYGEQHPNKAQQQAVVAMARWLVASYGLDAGALAGHRDHAATACPGDNLYAMLQEMRDAVSV